MDTAEKEAGTFQDYLKGIFMKAKVVFHIDWEKEENLVMALNNIQNLLKAVPAEETSVCLLANGPSVKLLLRDRALQYGPTILNLAEKGVRFLVCGNSLKNFDIAQNDLLAPCETVPAGVVELIRLQSEGYAYIKP
jgi:uncharacterized protein